MLERQSIIARSIVHSIQHNNDDTKQSVSGLFKTYGLKFHGVDERVFSDLRSVWKINDEDYRRSFGGGPRESDKAKDDGQGVDDGDTLLGQGDMGYSGSTFFTTQDGAYLVKSVPRHFEHSFFRDDLLLPYAEHMKQNPASLLVRITDFLECNQVSIGSMFGMAPSHHIVMENILYGQDAAKNHTSGSNNGGEGDQQESQQQPNDMAQDEMEPSEEAWKFWDLKPMSYFYPERDVAGGALSSEATKSKLADDFEEHILLSLDLAEDFAAQLEKDTALLRKCNAVDYSLFLVRIPVSAASDPAAAPPAEPPFAPPFPPSWRTGIPSSDGKYLYRASILDFFWAKHKVHAMAMTGLINAYNVVDRQGPMSVTTTAEDYRERFLGMCKEFVQVVEEEGRVEKG